MKRADNRQHRDEPSGRESPLAILCVILINALALLILVGPLIATHMRH